MHPSTAGPRRISPGVLPQSLDANRVLSARQVADLLGISIATLRRQYWAGRLPTAIRLSERRVGWRVQDLLAHIEHRREVTF